MRKFALAIEIDGRELCLGYAVRAFSGENLKDALANMVKAFYQAGILKLLEVNPEVRLRYKQIAEGETETRKLEDRYSGIENLQSLRQSLEARQFSEVKLGILKKQGFEVRGNLYRKYFDDAWREETFGLRDENERIESYPMVSNEYGEELNKLVEMEEAA